MTYSIAGLDPADFAPLFAMDDAALAERGAMRVTAAAPKSFPCRISLVDAAHGETLILLHHISHDVPTPYRSAYAIFVRQNVEAAHYEDRVPPVFERRPIAMRGFDAQGMLRDAKLALPGEADAAIRALFADESIAYIDAHNAAHGCFAARVRRSET
ncbi:DUF1203 domain-containing protein [Sphingopyxis sp. MWB1]|uniref:DUF1203 domain-containing protein n=1 Tax=Sphingopyxis sp. MWB1 TaxID=1537715 RepID=UPI00051A3DCA|nr:DUF1203 domain-containing protein [Sphingopyxis sp. MWB1]